MISFFFQLIDVLFRYNPRYYFAIETSYGPTSDLKEMIDEMHKNGIRVILDGVRKIEQNLFISTIDLFRYTIIRIVHHH